MTQVSIPQDLINDIVDRLKSDRKNLAKCSFVSQSFRAPCQKHLFARLELDSRRAGRIKGLHHILALNPNLAHNARYLHLIFYEASSDQALPSILQALNNLRSISWKVLQAEPLSWIGLRPSLKAAMTKRLQSPGLSSIHISHVTDLPLSLFSLCTNLEKLMLSDVFPPTPAYHEIELETHSRPKARPRSLSVSSTFNADHSFAGVFTQLLTSVDLLHLLQLRVESLRRDDEILACQRVIDSSTNSLEDIRLVVKFTFRTPQQAFDLTSVTSLRRLSITMAQSPRMLEWLHAILLSANDNLEHVKLSLFDQLVADGNQVVLTKLAEIDGILADPRFVNLRSISLAFDSWMSRPIFGSSFTEQCVPKLASKGILSVYWNKKRLFTGVNFP